MLLAIGVIGCDSRGIPIVQIKGQLTFGGAPPPKEGKIMFSPVENPGSDKLTRPGYGYFDADGLFSVSTYSSGDGLIPGKYQAKILCFRETPTLTNQDAVSYVPRDFNPEVTIPDGESSFDMKLDVPATRLAEGRK